MHRDDDPRLDLPDHLGRPGGVKRVPTADRHQQDVHLVEPFDLLLGQRPAEIAEVADAQISSSKR
jgi:hypothetical protein